MALDDECDSRCGELDLERESFEASAANKVGASLRNEVVDAWDGIRLGERGEDSV